MQPLDLGVWIGANYTSVLDDRDPRDLAARDAYFRAATTPQRAAPWPIKATRIARAMVREPRAAVTLGRWALRLARRAEADRAPDLGFCRPRT